MSECHCLIRHWQTPAERERVVEGLEYARKVGDRMGIMLSLAMLTGDCPARKKGKVVACDG